MSDKDKILAWLKELEDMSCEPPPLESETLEYDIGTVQTTLWSAIDTLRHKLRCGGHGNG